MAISLSTIFYAFVAYILYSVIRARIVEYRFQQFARRNGCEEEKRNTLNKLPWGVDGLYRIVKSASRGQDLLDDIVVPQFQKLRANTTVGTGLLGVQVTSTIEPRNIQALLATNFQDFGTGARRAKQFGALLGKNIFTSDGEFWAHSRALFRPLFNREQINDLEETDRAAKILIDVLPVGEGGWTQEVNLMDYFYRFTLDTATAFLVGQTTDSQLTAAGRLTSEKGSLGEMAANREFTDAFAVAQEWLSWRIRFQGLYWLIQSRRWWRATAVVQKFVNYYVEMALEQKAREEKMGQVTDGGKKYNLLRELTQECRDPIELRDQLLGILAAGRDTTAALLSWTMVELAINPDIYAKLRRTILEDFGEASASTNASNLNFAKLKSCRYLQHVLQESLRLHPAVPFNNRQAVRDTVLPMGGGPDQTKPIAIRKGQVVGFVPYAMQRRKDLWGEDADVFKPERWDGRKIGWDYLPFSGGPRICLGQQYAITEASFLLVRLLQTYDSIDWLGETGGRIKKGFGLIMYPANGVPVRLHRAA